jgi:hypothetical protein
MDKTLKQLFETALQVTFAASAEKDNEEMPLVHLPSTFEEFQSKYSKSDYYYMPDVVDYGLYCQGTRWTWTLFATPQLPQRVMRATDLFFGKEDDLTPSAVTVWSSERPVPSTPQGRYEETIMTSIYEIGGEWLVFSAEAGMVVIRLVLLGALFNSFAASSVDLWWVVSLAVVAGATGTTIFAEPGYRLWEFMLPFIQDRRFFSFYLGDRQFFVLSL